MSEFAAMADREFLNKMRVIYDRYYNVARSNGCDVSQAHTIAREKTLSETGGKL